MATRNTSGTNGGPTFVSVGENLKYAIVDGEMLVKFPMGYRGRKSASGKTVAVASTRGNIPVGDGVYLSVNAYAYPEEAEQGKSD